MGITVSDWIKLRSISSHCQLISLWKQVSSVKLLEGDTMVMGSDGLFDNVFDHEIVSTITQHSDVVEAGTCLEIQLFVDIYPFSCNTAAYFSS